MTDTSVSRVTHLLTGFADKHWVAECGVLCEEATLNIVYTNCRDCLLREWHKNKKNVEFGRLRDD